MDVKEESIVKLKSFINDNDKFLIIGHMSPDGDAVGSCLALYHLLIELNKSVRVVVPNVFPSFLRWLPNANLIMQYDFHKAQVDRMVAESEVIFCLDFNALKRIGDMCDVVAAATAKKVMIDHHLDPERCCDITISCAKMCSTAELIYHIILDLGYGEMINKTVATCIYTGMMTDTGGFTYNSNRRDIYTTIGNLLTTGIDKDEIYRKVNYSYSMSRMQLEGYVLNQKLKVWPMLNASLINLTRDELKQYNYISGDSEGFVNKPLQIQGMRLSCFLREDKDIVKVSLRSIGDFPCNEMAAQFFNGGGHKNASGGEYHGTMDEAIAQYEKAINAFKKQLMN
jgi:bifunctional oligoribonuclease and PAP phosphatase NrnA